MSHGLVRSSEVKPFGLGEEPVETDALKPCFDDLPLEDSSLLRSELRNGTTERERGNLDTGVADRGGVGEGPFKRPVLKGLVADRVIHGATGSGVA